MTSRPKLRPEDQLPLELEPPQDEGAHESELIKFVGYDKALIGRTTAWSGTSRPERLVYDGTLIAAILEADGMTYEEALEWIDFNVEGAYVGEHTPIVVWPATMEEVDELEAFR